MRITFSLALVALTSFTSARPLLGLDFGSLLSSLGPASDDDPRWTSFQHPGIGDVRSPCPGLNALANHGFLHHDGRNMTIPHLVEGISAGLNIGPDVSIALGALTLQRMVKTSFDLDELNTHINPIEHDGSISRQDDYFGSAVPFNSDSYEQYMAFFEGRDETDIQTAAQARFARFNDSVTRNPQITYGQRQTVLSMGENVLYLQALADPESGVAKIAYMDSLFKEEKLPYELGWRPSTETITLGTLGSMLLKLQDLTPKPIADIPVYVVGTLKDEMLELIGGIGKLAGLTQGLSSALGF